MLDRDRCVEVFADASGDLFSFPIHGTGCFNFLVNFPLGKPVNTGWRHIGRNLVPVSDIAVRLALARGERVREARLATSEERLDVRERDGWAEVVVPKLV